MAKLCDDARVHNDGDVRDDPRRLRDLGGHDDLPPLHRSVTRSR